MAFTIEVESDDSKFDQLVKQRFKDMPEVAEVVIEMCNLGMSIEDWSNEVESEVGKEKYQKFIDLFFNE